MKQAINNVAAVLQGLQKELARLTEASNAGKLAERGKHDQFQGAYAEIVRGVNAILDAVIAPLNVSAKYVELISKGDIPPQITDTYNGDFNLIKNNLNTLIAAMNEITAAAEEIANGNLTVDLRERSPQDKLMQALSAMVGGLTRTVSDIRSIAGEVAAASQSISTASIQVSKGASAQAAAAEEASSSMEEMVSNIKQNADNAQQTDKIANKSAKDAQESGKIGARSGGRDEGDRQQDLDHRGDCAPDQPAGAERGHRSGARRRARQGVCRGGGRGAQAGRAQPEGGRRDQPALRDHAEGVGEIRRDAGQAGARYSAHGGAGAGDHRQPARSRTPAPSRSTRRCSNWSR